ncbi:MAG: PhzF family phenazine biosynthesis protein [Burkholderiaceae bacterium]|nr:PhzF family phenazine biosynthesis protein [Burkholderiaceae bacterium]
MAQYSYRLLNVFAESTFGGNPLCVFEDGTGLDEPAMLDLARQFNLSETVFLFPGDEADEADASLRIFTPSGELPFAGHPSIGSAHVLRQLLKHDTVRLRTKAGIVPLSFENAQWKLTAPREAGQALMRPCELESAELCRMLDLAVEDLAAEPLWIDTGSEQLLLPLRSVEAVQRARPAAQFAEQWPANRLGRRNVFLFAVAGQAEGSDLVSARYFFKSANGVGEDPGTGSACINLGAWFYMQVMPIARRAEITQGVEIGRPCRILLELSAQGGISIGGRVIELGSGQINL